MAKDYKNLHRGRVLSYYWKVIRNFKVSFFSMIFFQVLASILDIYIPYQYLRLWKVLVTVDAANLAHARAIVIFILILNIVRWVFRRINTFTSDYLVANAMEGLRSQAFSYMIGHSNAFFADSFGGSLVQKINKYAKSFQTLVDRMLSDGLPLVVRVIGTVIALSILAPEYAYILGVFCVVFIGTTLIATRKKLIYDIKASEADTKTTGALADSIGNHASIQLFTGHTHELSLVGKAVNNQKKAVLLNWYLWDSLSALQAVYMLVTEFIVFWVALGQWSLGIIALPIFILLQTYLLRLIETLWNVGGLVRVFYDTFAEAQEMVVIFDTPYSVDDTQIKATIEHVKGDVAFNNVTYVYDRNNTKVFDDFSLMIPAGQKIAIVGSSGAGKSTFVRLIMRLFNVTQGSITIDGINIADVSQENLREQIAFVPQDPVLFHRTLIENIRYGRRDATDDEVKRAATLAHCDEFIDRLPYGYETYVGERGVKLSGGERQRVAIARAILKNAPILILDEATSALDSHSEALIQDALHTLIKDKTTIVIAHRLSTVREMDRIVVIDQGKIAEDGTHDKLIRKKVGIYKKLWDLQAGGFKLQI